MTKFDPGMMASGRCPDPCGKKRFTVRRGAKAIALDMAIRHPGEQFDVYRCPFHPDYFHVGHRPDDISDRGREGISDNMRKHARKKQQE